MPPSCRSRPSGSIPPLVRRPSAWKSPPITYHRSAALCFRREMPPDAGMLFDLHQNERIAFWMKNTVLPLDMVFIRSDGTVSSIEPNATPYSTDPIPSAEPVRAVAGDQWRPRLRARYQAGRPRPLRDLPRRGLAAPCSAACRTLPL
ncbi:MAG: DUF192 domain-containing protein [Rhizomicrobium sp.]